MTIQISNKSQDDTDALVMKVVREIKIQGHVSSVLFLKNLLGRRGMDFAPSSVIVLLNRGVELGLVLPVPRLGGWCASPKVTW